MMSDWPTLSLDDVCDKITDGAHHSPKSVEFGKPMASVKDLTHFGVDLTEARLITEKEFRKLVKQGCQPEVGDVLIAKDGNSALDTVCTVDEPLDAVLLSSVAILRPNKEKLDSSFLKYYFCSEQTIDYLKGSFISGAAIPRVVLKDFRKAEITVPPLNIQKDISKVLKALDNKIELNRQTNQTLEQIAQAIFKSWFVDFEPTRAKIIITQKYNALSPRERAGVRVEQAQALAAQAIICGAVTLEDLATFQLDSPPINAHLLGRIHAKLDAQTSEELSDNWLPEPLAATAALFPNALVDSELGEIPEGWEVKLNGDVMDVRDGTHDSPKQSETGFPLVTSKHITTGVLKIEDAYLISEEDYEKVNKRSKVNQGDILLTMIGTVGIPYLISQPEVNFAIKNVGLFRTSEVDELKNYFYLLLKSSQMKAYLDARMAGTTQKYLSLKVLRSLELVVPSNVALNAFNAQINPIMEMIFSNITESRDLAGVRDTLLPKLLSGELSVTYTNTHSEAL